MGDFRPALPEISRPAESIELRMTEAFWALLPRELAQKRRLESFRVGCAFVTVAPKSASLQRNRVCGLGVDEPASAAMVDEILNLFRARGVKRLSFHVSPCSQSESVAGWLRERGFRFHHNYSKLIRSTAPPATIATSFEIRRIGKSRAADFARVFGSLFAWQSDRLGWIAATVGAPGFSHYLAFDSDRPVATALLYVNGGWAWMGWAGTLTPFRCRGAHTALIAARLTRAAALGAERVACETLEPQPGRPSGSYRGLIRQGFEQAYLRPIWVWEQK